MFTKDVKLNNTDYGVTLHTEDSNYWIEVKRDNRNLTVNEVGLVLAVLGLRNEFSSSGLVFSSLLDANWHFLLFVTRLDEFAYTCYLDH